jgi:arylsulfatase A-like enzyme
MTCSRLWLGHIKPGTVKNQMFSALDWVPTLIDIAGGPKGDGLKKQIEAGQYPGIVKTTRSTASTSATTWKAGRKIRRATPYFYYTGATMSSRSRARGSRRSRAGYLVINRLGDTGVGGDGEIAKVSHTFHPSGR